MAKAKPKRKEREICKIMIGIWSSLESHLKYTYSGPEQKFDKKCVVEYAEMLLVLSKIL